MAHDGQITLFARLNGVVSLDNLSAVHYVAEGLLTLMHPRVALTI
jgi:hypothetical protein